MGKTEVILLCLAAITLLAIARQRLPIPFPILLTMGGIGLAIIPGLPAVELDPQVVFNLFLPPLIYPAAVFTSWRDFRRNLPPIILLATVLVIITMTVVAWVLHALTGLPLAVGFVFGALISPPDAVAALAITKDLPVPRRLIVILEGESLVNDATSFISYRFALAAVMTGTFSLGHASLQFLVVATGGLAVGLAVGWLAGEAQRRLDDPPVQTMLSLLTPYLAYFAAEKLHVSGILAVVIAGILYGWRAPKVLTSRMRLQALPVWEMVGFILNGLLFVLIGLQLPRVIHALPSISPVSLTILVVAIMLAIVLTRFAWMFGSSFLSRLFKLRKGSLPWQQTALVAWTGLRGADSLAAALAIPFFLPTGVLFPGRDLILFLTFCVVLGTLVLEGLTLAPMARRLRVVDDHVTEKEERIARLKANEAALAHLETLESVNRAKPKTVERLRAEYLDRIQQLRAEGPAEKTVRRLFSPDFETLAREALETERDTVIKLRTEEEINEQAFRRIQRDIDLAEARLQRPA